MNKIGVIIARFQSPYLHEGHKAIIESVRKKHNKTVIVLGISPVLGSRRNPLDFPTRERMIRKEYPEVLILPLRDHPLDTTWSQNLDKLLTDTFPGADFLLYGGRDGFNRYYSGSFEVIELPEAGTHNSTLIREQLRDRVIDSEEFRTGIIYAYSNTYVKVYATVDIAVFRNEKKELLLGRKTIDHKWRLLGGFSDITDDSYEAAAQRELHEECGEIETTPMKYEGSLRVDDWRYRHEEDKIITSIFSTDFISGIPRGSDDIAEVRWFTWPEIAALGDQMAEEHGPQMKLLTHQYGTKK